MAYALDTDSFLNAFYRMVRCYPTMAVLRSSKELRDFARELEQEKITKSTANQGVKWQFNPPLPPHFGGAHEAMIKAAKRAVYAILGNADIKYEELPERKHC